MGEEKADRTGIGPAGPYRFGDRRDPFRIRRPDRLPAGVDPLGKLETPFARHQGRRVPTAEVVHVRAHLAPDLQQVPEPLGRHHGDGTALALDQGVRCDGGAVGETDDIRRDKTVAPRHLPETGKDRPTRVVRRRGALEHQHPPRVPVDRIEVGERASDINPHDPTHCPTPPDSQSHPPVLKGTPRDREAPPMREASIERKTNETEITVRVGLDGTGLYRADTGIGFLDHMLEQLSRHSLIDLDITAKGDLHIDAHHTTEDSGIAIGQAVSRALGERRGIRRYGHAYVPMDETLVRVALDLSNRPYLIWQMDLPAQRLGGMDTELFREWFQAFSQHAGATLHVSCLYGLNTHHIVEAAYKALARALRSAVEIDPRRDDAPPSTKGSL